MNSRFLLNLLNQNDFASVHKIAKELYCWKQGVFLVKILTKAEHFHAQIAKRKEQRDKREMEKEEKRRLIEMEEEAKIREQVETEK